MPTTYQCDINTAVTSAYNLCINKHGWCINWSGHMGLKQLMFLFFSTAIYVILCVYNSKML